MTEPAVPAIAPASPDVEANLRLTLVSGVGPRIRQLLLERFGSAAAVFSAAPSELREVHGVGPKLCRALTRAHEEIDVAEELDLCQRHGIRILLDSEGDYPRVLREIADPPGVLYVSGKLEPRDAASIAIVGSRHATHYGVTQAERLAASLARAGLTVYSGLARGIDAAAHRGALNAGGRTVAVLGSGLLNIYPPEHRQLACEVRASGAIISELPVRAKPLQGTFPQRNRLISGLSLGVIVVEASDRSGALITARHAMEQGREVFAVPGRVDSRMSRGCHRLLRDGAKLVENADDVLEELGPLVEPAPKADGAPLMRPAELLLNEVEQQVLATVGLEPTTVDQIVERTGLETPQVLSTMTVLEMRRLVRRLGGFTFARTP